MTGRVETLVRRRGELLAALVLVAAAQGEIWTFSGSRALLIPLTFGWTVPLLVRRRYPLTAGLAVLGVLVVEAHVEFEGTENSIALLLAVVWAVLSVGSHENRRKAIAGGVLSFGLITAALAAGPGGLGFDDAVFTVIISVCPWLAGLSLRRRSERTAELQDLTARLKREQEAAAAAAAAEARTAIARELHEVISRSVNAMTVQAGAARVLLAEDPERARRAVEVVEETGREALAETRRLLGMLRRDMADPLLAPQPGLTDLGRLASDFETRGLAVDVRVDGAPVRLSPGAGLAAYRIVEEALMQALRRESGCRVRVTVRYEPQGVALAVEDDGSDGGVIDSSSMVGLRERVRLYGGELEAGPVRHGGYVVKARIPQERT